MCGGTGPGVQPPPPTTGEGVIVRAHGWIESNHLTLQVRCDPPVWPRSMVGHIPGHRSGVAARSGVRLTSVARWSVPTHHTEG